MAHCAPYKFLANLSAQHYMVCGKGLLKGVCHQMDIFFVGLNNKISTFCMCAGGFYIF
jgi:hypothetical protein